MYVSKNRKMRLKNALYGQAQARAQTEGLFACCRRSITPLARPDNFKKGLDDF